MDKYKYISSDSKYLDDAKSITNYLFRLFEDDDPLNRVLASTAIGVYAFLRVIAKSFDEDKKIKPLDLYSQFGEWIEWADSVFSKNEVQA